jgi:hypothetical protein
MSGHVISVMATAASIPQQSVAKKPAPGSTVSPPGTTA